MARSHPANRYPKPPERSPFEPFPAAVPWDTPLSELQWWLEIRCVCGKTTQYPIPLLAARIGWKKDSPRDRAQAPVRGSATATQLGCASARTGPGESVHRGVNDPKPLVICENGRLVTDRS